MKWIRQYTFLVAAVVSLIFAPTAAHAFTLLQCNPADGTVLTGTLFNEDAGASGSSCKYSSEPIIEHVFTQIICNFTIIVNQIMGQMYCGLQFALIDTIKILLIIYVAVYGAQMLIGTAQLNAKDGIIRLIKLGVVWSIASNAAYGISFIFEFFMSFIATASKAVINTLAFAVPVEDDGVCANIPVDGSDLLTLYDFLDYMVCHALVGPAASANTKVLGFFMAMIWTLFPMYTVAVWWFTTTFKTLVRTVIGFLKCLATIAFLVTLSPIFLSFMLFKVTSHLFENWLRFMIAFSVQVIIVFGIIVCWILVVYQFIGFFNDLSDLIFPYVPTNVPGPVYAPANGYAICPPIYGTNGYGEPTAVCPSGFDANPPPCDDMGICSAPTNPNWEQHAKALIAPAEVINQAHFLYYVFFHLITLLLITYAFSVLLEKADEIAKSLAGPSNIPTLLPGFGQNGFGNFKSPQTPKMFSAGARDAGKSVGDVASRMGGLAGKRK